MSQPLCCVARSCPKCLAAGITQGTGRPTETSPPKAANYNAAHDSQTTGVLPAVTSANTHSIQLRAQHVGTRAVEANVTDVVTMQGQSMHTVDHVW
jgi:hypothetical protein